MARKTNKRLVKEDETGGRSKSRREKTKDLPRTTKAAETKMRLVTVTPRTKNQELLVKELDTKILTIVAGPAGSGKTYLAAYAAARALQNKEVLNIFITRTMVTVGKAIGHLPGTEVDKMLPYVAPLLEYFAEFFGKEEVAKMIRTEVIRVVPVALLRGYTFKDTFVIIDEAQNTTPHEFKTIITRIGENSKMVILGDLEQSDLQGKDVTSGPEDFIGRMRTENANIGIAVLDESDIMRSELVRDIVNIYNGYDDEDEDLNTEG